MFKAYFFHSHKCTLYEELEYLTEPNQQHSKHVHSKENNQIIKVIEHIPATLTKFCHELMLEWKVLHVINH